MKIVSKNPEKFVKKSSTKHDEYIRKVCKEIESSTDNLSYQNIEVPLLVKKPWGEETLIGINSKLELWELIINPGSSTSYHCHPNKDTLLIVINGTAELRTEEGKEILQSGDFRFLDKKACHQIKSIGKTPLLKLEIESPVNKNDLVRIEDSYAREGKAYLHKSKIENRENLTEIILLNRNKINDYLKKQNQEDTFESKFPIHITTNLGATRELYTPKSILKQFGEVSPGFAAVLEIFVPSLDEIERSKKAQKDNYDNLLIRLDEIAQERSKGYLRGNSRDIHGNVWNEVFIVLSGEMTFVEFEPTQKEKEIMKKNNGSVYELSSIEEVKKRKFKNLSIKRMKPGDIFFSPAGTAHGVFNGDNALYLVFINKNKDFEYWMKEFWGENSKKYKLNKKIALELKNKDVNSVSSYWGEYSGKEQ